MAYVTEQQLEGFAESYNLEERASQFLNSSMASTGLSIFLSHTPRRAGQGSAHRFGELAEVEIHEPGIRAGVVLSISSLQ